MIKNRTIAFFGRAARAAVFAAGISATLFPLAARARMVERPSVVEAERFVTEAEKRLLALWIKAERAAWVQANFITDDTDRLSADASQEVIAATMELAAQARRFDGLNLPFDVDRKLRLLRTSLPMVAPSDDAKQEELAQIASWMKGVYGKGQYCPQGKECLSLDRITRILAESRDPEELLDLWRGWHTIAPVMRPRYERFVTLANEGARELGFADLGALWRSGYDVPPDRFSAEVDRLWDQVRPLYVPLHCYVRSKLAERYGKELVREGEPMPAHLLGNMWAQDWSNIYDLVKPAEDRAGYDLTELLKAKNVDEREMVRYGERFFTSLGFAPLPETFWQRSLFAKPRDRDVVCHASAWDIDWKEDLRLKMCIQITGEDFATVHHELGHSVYQRAYNRQSPLYADSANDGFHEGIGDTIALSVTPDYLVKVGLLERLPERDGDIGFLMKMALDKVAFLPFGLLVDQWRWKVFSGEIGPGQYNRGWWDLRQKYQGVAPPLPRSEADFDPGAKYHVPSVTPYTRYFLAHVLQFQFHRALCREAGHKGPLHRCSIYGSKRAGAKLSRMLEMGRSRPWPEALRVLSGETETDARAILDYFAPLKRWLERQNEGKTCGWPVPGRS